MSMFCSRQLNRELNNDPFMDDFAYLSTLAGAVLRNVRTNNLKSGVLPITTKNGYHNQNQSVIAIKYMTWFAFSHNVHVMHYDNAATEHK
jgi:purine nucleoside permease